LTEYVVFDTCEANLVDHVELCRSDKGVSHHCYWEMKPWPLMALSKGVQKACIKRNWN